MKGIILAAGKGTRLYPITKTLRKSLLPVYDKPMIYYPLATLLNAEITEILIIVPPGDMGQFEKLLGDGSSLGISISYKEQQVPRGIADAFIVGKDFIGKDSVCLALGDNIFYGADFSEKVKNAQIQNENATVFGYYVEDPKPFGVVEFSADGKALSIEEKPLEPKSNYIIPGLYFYDNSVVGIAQNVKPSKRGELEITSVNQTYLEQQQLKVVALNTDYSWFDTGSASSLLIAANAIAKEQHATKKQVACIEEIAYKKGLIDFETLQAIGEKYSMTDYGQYILSLKKE
ncbi:MAG: glucose-1-phosphate thymidylyltransferase RfbA [Clostridiales bacterium]